MKQKLLASLILLGLLTGMLPAAALAAPGGAGQAPQACICTEACMAAAVRADCPVCSVESTGCSARTAGSSRALLADEAPGASPANPLVVPEEGYAFQSGTIYGISAAWYREQSVPEGQTLYLSIQLPEAISGQSITRICDNAFSGWSSEKGKVTDAIGNTGTSDCKYALAGVADLSRSGSITIGKQAFNNCTGLTGVVLPNTLTTLGTADGATGSVFNGCSGLQFVRTAGGDPETVFELPASLKVIGKQTFKDTFTGKTDIAVKIPAGVETIGTEAFYDSKSSTSCFSQFYIQRPSDDGYEGYHTGAFKALNTGDRLLIFPDAQGYSSTGTFSRINKTYPVTLSFHNGTDTVAFQQKLYGRSIQYTRDSNGLWFLDEDYRLPAAGVSGTKPGYDAGWVIEGGSRVLTSTSSVSGAVKDELPVTVMDNAVVSKPTVAYTVNGSEVAPGTGVQELEVTVSDGHPGSVGVTVTHPLATEEARETGTYVYFEYCWWDEVDNAPNGPRSTEEPRLFSRAASSLQRVFTDQNTIPIRSAKDARVDGDYYLVEIYAYYVENNGTPKLYYKSNHNFIGAAQDGTHGEGFVMNVTVTDTTPITITPADITIYSGGEGSYSGIVNDEGESSQTTGFPEPGYYITLPDDLNDLLGGEDHAADLSGKLSLRFQDDDGSAPSRTWELALYGTEAHSTNIEIAGEKRARCIYRLLPAQVDGAEIPAHLQIMDAGGSTVESSTFTPEAELQYKEYTIQFCTDGLDFSKLTFALTLTDEATGRETTYTRDAALGEGTLVVRGVMDGADAIREIVSTPEGIKTTGKIAAVAPEHVTYYVNGSKVKVADPSGVRLLADSLIGDEAAAQAMFDYIRSDSSSLDIPVTENTAIQPKYLDLVDSSNGNAYLTMGSGQEMTIYWPVPSDCNEDTTAYIVHFAGLDRNYDDASAVLQPQQTELAPPVTVNGARYFTFAAGSFSPFVLVYEKTVSSGGGGVTYYTIRAEAGEGGAISPSGSVQVTYGARKTFTIQPSAGHQIADVLVDGKRVGAVSSYTFENIRANHTIRAVFEEKPQILHPDETGVSDWLNTRDHTAYLNGYDTGLFGPADDMTRAEAAQMFYNLLRNKQVTITAAFSDVPAGAWYGTAVHTLASLGFLEGVGDGRFEPERPISRAEFTALAMRFADLDVSGENIFSDVHPGDWFHAPVVGSIQYGWITGYADGTFRPNNTIARAEAAAAVNRMLGRAADEDYVDRHTDGLRLFPDVPKTYWAYYIIAEASNAHAYATHTGVEVWTRL